MGVFGALAAFLQKLFGRVQESIFGLVGSRFALQAAVVAGIVAVIAAAYTAINALLAGLSAAMPSELVTAATWVVPTNFDECVTAVLSAYAIKAAMDYKVMLINSQGGVSR